MSTLAFVKQRSYGFSQSDQFFFICINIDTTGSNELRVTENTN